MYFSRVRIRTDILKSSQLGLVLQGNSYGSHRLLWDLFPDQGKRTFLYREEIAREQLAASAAVRGEPIYYLLSHVKPVANDDSLFRLETKLYQPKKDLCTTNKNSDYRLKLIKYTLIVKTHPPHERELEYESRTNDLRPV